MRISDSRGWNLDSFSDKNYCIPDSNSYWESGFLELNSGTRIPKLRIPHLTSKNFADFRILIT